MSHAAVADRPTSDWQIVVADRPLYARVQRSNYYTQTVKLDDDIDPRRLRVVRFEPAPSEEFDF